MERKIPLGTKRCLRAEGCKLIIPEADLDVPVNVATFHRTMSYSRKEVRPNIPEAGMQTIELGCAVRGCPVYVELVTTEGQVRPNDQLWYDTDGCRRT
ncbi:MAG: hypothetical protein M3Q14_01885 [bacterium]|nr:hypothetical protein [bacterium]